MKVGDRVRVVAEWSQFFGYQGVIVSLAPHPMVRLAGVNELLRFDPESLAVFT